MVYWAFAGLILGAIAGSFLATAAVRWPAGRTLAGRSACDGCGRVLGPVELIPVLGYLIRHGRCPTCGALIDPRHLQIELAAAGIGVLAFAIAPGLVGLVGALFGWQLLLLAVLDLEHFWLPDRATGLLALTGIAAGAAGAQPFPNDRLIGAAAGYLILWLVARGYRRVRRREGLGGGDPKLFGAVGAWIGWTALPFVLLGAGLIGLGAVLIARLRGADVPADMRLPFGTLLALAAWAMWIVQNG